MNNSAYSVFSDSTPTPLRGLSASNSLYFASGNTTEVDLAEHDRIELPHNMTMVPIAIFLRLKVLLLHKVIPWQLRKNLSRIDTVINSY